MPKQLVGIWELPKEMTEDEQKSLAQQIADRVAEQIETDCPSGQPEPSYQNTRSS